MISAEATLIVLVGYVLGCLTTGYYVTRLVSQEDIRDHGSGSVGATNVRRLLGLPAAAVTFLVDLAKGFAGVWAVTQLGLGYWLAILLMLAVVAGHIWPIQLRFRGGKGVATGLGAVLALDHQLVLVVLISCVVLVSFTKRLVPTGLLVIAVSPGLAIILGRPGPLVLGMVALAILVLFAHRANIRDLVSAMRGVRPRGEAMPRP
jgi:acyl phosphate:glycerol-3-phosphate acyltransferase